MEGGVQPRKNGKRCNEQDSQGDRATLIENTDRRLAELLAQSGVNRALIGTLLGFNAEREGRARGTESEDPEDELDSITSKLNMTSHAHALSSDIKETWKAHLPTLLLGQPVQIVKTHAVLRDMRSQGQGEDSSDPPLGTEPDFNETTDISRLESEIVQMPEVLVSQIIGNIRDYLISFDLVMD